ncbi:MAG: FABP family protein [Acidimicrobiales bacterium]|jgi:hypothetical protein|nr:FABP family protein [Acidimicrobiales bacterium]
MTGPEIHPSLEPLTHLLGTWEGPGEGSYPTIDSFAYVERLTFSHVGKPFLSYAQRTWDPATRAPMHAETGYLRVAGEPAGAGVEMVVAQPTGVTEVLLGTVADGVVALRSHVVGLTPTAKSVTAVERELAVDGDGLVVRLAMAAVGVELTHHLLSRLRRVDPT